MIAWPSHVGACGTTFDLKHLHPFAMPYELAATEKHVGRSLTLHVGFGMHTFTRSIQAADDPKDYYSDRRETRMFCRDRYALSKQLPTIVSELNRRPCRYARAKSGIVNYVTIDLSGAGPYGVFFNVRRLLKVGPDAIELAVLSAYPFTPGKPDPTIGKVGFNVLIGHASRGTKPHPP